MGTEAASSGGCCWQVGIGYGLRAALLGAERVGQAPSAPRPLVWVGWEIGVTAAGVAGVSGPAFLCAGWKGVSSRACEGALAAKFNGTLP